MVVANGYHLVNLSSADAGEPCMQGSTLAMPLGVTRPRVPPEETLNVGSLIAYKQRPGKWKKRASNLSA